MQSLRNRQMRNLAAALLLSHGVPMVQMGDEYGHTKVPPPSPPQTTPCFPGLGLASRLFLRWSSFMDIFGLGLFLLRALNSGYLLLLLVGVTVINGILPVNSAFPSSVFVFS